MFNKNQPGRHFKRSGASLQGTLSNWVTTLIDSRISEREKRKVSNRAWDLYLNDAMAKGIIEGLVAEVVNTGITPQPQPMAGWLGKDAAWQNEYQKKTYDLFEIWGLDFRNFCDATGRCNIYMLQALALFHWKLEGIAIFQVVMQDQKNRPLGLSVLPIDPGRLITPTDSKISKDIYDGLELDKNGAIKKAWILKPNKTYNQYSAKQDDCISIDATNKETGLPNMFFVCDTRNVAEYRQDSIMSPMIKEIKDSNDFVDAALVKALIQNLWTASVTSDTGTTGHDKPNDDWADRIQEMEKGTLIFGRDGEKVDFLDSSSPGPGYDIMNKSIVSRLGMATGRGAENVARSYTSSYSASQASIENATRFDDFDRMILTNRFCQPLFSLMQYEAVLMGILPVTSIEHFKENLYSYTRTDWMPPPSRSIDHNKEAKADSERLSNHTRNFSDIYGRQGQDWRAALRQKAIEKAYMQDLENEYKITFDEENEVLPSIDPVIEGKEDK